MNQDQRKVTLCPSCPYKEQLEADMDNKISQSILQFIPVDCCYSKEFLFTNL